MSGRPPNSGARSSVREIVAMVREQLDVGWVVVCLLGLLAAVVAVVVATRVFPYHSLNHDEGVYLQQAEMLLSGRLFLQPPVDGPYRPWFFVESDQGLYSKYQPVPAAVFALGRLLGGYPIALAGIAATVVAGTAALARELFDWRVGAVAGVLVLASPLFLVHSGVYLPYALTAGLELCFAVSYLRAERTESRRLAALAGVAVGLAFFTRPYTAVLFSTPFIIHAVATLARSGAWRTPFGNVAAAKRALFGRRLVTAALGTAGVLAALGYNVLVTGDPLVFPYQAFAPEDGIGFGHRQILAHEETYTVELALESNRRVLTQLFTDWVAMGLVGAGLAAVGVAGTVGTAFRCRTTALTARRVTLAGLFLTIPAGNVAFWGNFNILGALPVEDDGLIHHLGPYYHYDLLIPTAVFGAVAAVWGADWLRGVAARRFPDDIRAARIAVALLVVAAGVGGAVAAASTADGPIERNAAVSDELETAYAPFATNGGISAGNAVIDGNASERRTVTFMPAVYGPWLNHPFQAVRNDPTFDGQSLYVVGDDDELAVAGAHPNHTLQRYVIRGAWTPTDGDPVTAELRQVERVSGAQVSVNTTVGVPESAESVSIRAGSGAGQTYAAANASTGTLALNVTVADGEAWLTGERAGDENRFAVADRDEITVTVYVSTGPGAGSGFSYRFVFPVDTGGEDVRVLSPTRERCPVPDRCVPAGLGPSPAGQFANATVSTVGSSEP